MTLASASVVQARAFSGSLPWALLGLTDFRQALQCCIDTLLALTRRTFACGLGLAIRRTRVGLDLVFQALHFLVGFLKIGLEFVFATKRGGPGTGANPHAVLSHTFEFDHVCSHQRRHVLAE